MSQSKQKNRGFKAFDWRSEELLAFAEAYSKRESDSLDSRAHTVGSIRIGEYFLGRFREKGSTIRAGDEKYEKLQVKTLVAGLITKVQFTSSGKLAGDPFS